MKPGRNQPCHCGSDKKYKKCCLVKDQKKAAKKRAKAAKGPGKFKRAMKATGKFFATAATKTAKGTAFVAKKTAAGTATAAKFTASKTAGGFNATVTKVKEFKNTVKAAEQLAEGCDVLASQMKEAMDNGDLLQTAKALRAHADNLEAIAKSK